MPKRPENVDDLLADYLSDEDDISPPRASSPNTEPEKSADEDEGITVTSFAEAMESRQPRTTEEIEALLGAYLADGEVTKEGDAKAGTRPSSQPTGEDVQLQALMKAYRQGDDRQVAAIAEQMKARRDLSRGSGPQPFIPTESAINEVLRGDPRSRPSTQSLPEVESLLDEPQGSSATPYLGPEPLSIKISENETVVIEGEDEGEGEGEGEDLTPFDDDRGTIPGLGLLGPEELGDDENPEDDWT
jgi:hypothetical protein